MCIFGVGDMIWMGWFFCFFEGIILFVSVGVFIGFVFEVEVMWDFVDVVLWCEIFSGMGVM